MKYTEEHLPNGNTKAILEFNSLDFEFVELDQFDRRLLRECDTSNLIADKLLALEMLARKLGDKVNEKTKSTHS